MKTTLATLALLLFLPLVAEAQSQATIDAFGQALAQRVQRPYLSGHSARFKEGYGVRIELQGVTVVRLRFPSWEQGRELRDAFQPQGFGSTVSSGKQVMTVDADSRGVARSLTHQSLMGFPLFGLRTLPPTPDHRRAAAELAQQLGRSVREVRALDWPLQVPRRDGVISWLRPYVRGSWDASMMPTSAQGYEVLLSGGLRVLRLETHDPHRPTGVDFASNLPDLALDDDALRLVEVRGAELILVELAAPDALVLERARRATWGSTPAGTVFLALRKGKQARVAEVFGQQGSFFREARYRQELLEHDALLQRQLDGGTQDLRVSVRFGKVPVTQRDLDHVRATPEVKLLRVDLEGAKVAVGPGPAVAALEAGAFAHLLRSTRKSPNPYRIGGSAFPKLADWISADGQRVPTAGAASAVSGTTSNP